MCFYHCCYFQAVLLLVVLDGALDGILSEDRAVNLYRREGKFFYDSHVIDSQSLIDTLPLEPLGSQA